MPEKRWVPKACPDENFVNFFCAELGVRPAIATIMVQRGLTDLAGAKHWFNPLMQHLHDPMLMKDMDRALQRINDAVKNAEKILVYGDYDVDGTTSVALVYSFLQTFYGNIDFYIPDRATEGYGISNKGIDFAAENNFKLVIALDCGIKAVEKINRAKQAGVDFIICDHHTPGAIIPPAVAILNPKQTDCPYPYKELSGCGIGFKLVQAYAAAFNIEIDLTNYLDLVVCSIASDIVPLTGENRTLAYYGLQKLNSAPRPGIKALKEQANYLRPYRITDVVFKLGPRINAAGRVSHARNAVELLLAQSMDVARRMAKDIGKSNTLRQDLDSTITYEAMQMIEQDQDLLNRKSTVLYRPEWHKGVIGIVASRLIEKFYRPTIMLTQSNGMVVGSARSVAGYNLYDAINQCTHLLEQFGGHKAAAGLTMREENVPHLQKMFEEVVGATITEDQLQPTIEYDIELPFADIDFRFFNTIMRFAPFGPENMRPVFMSRGVRNFAKPRILKEEHLKLSLVQEDGQFIEAIGFKMAHLYEQVQRSPKFDVCYCIEDNEYLGNRSLQLVLKDIKVSE